jgi:hypothetical protein
MIIKILQEILKGCRFRKNVENFQQNMKVVEKD